MKILFVRPKPSPRTVGLQHLMIVEPLELEVLAALAGKEDEVQIVDMILEDRPLEHFIDSFQPDMLCITGYITHIDIMKDYSQRAKAYNPETITVVGGVQVEKFPETLESEYIDFRVVRNATRTFPALLHHLKYDTPLPLGVLTTGATCDPGKLPDYDFFFPLPRRDLTARYRAQYFYVFHDKVALIKTSFGCPFKCNFCYCRFITDDHYFARPLDEVIAELKSIREREVYIIDDDFLLSAKRVRAFIDLVKANHIHKKYLIYGRADFIIQHPELIRDFREIGLRTIIVGLESFQDEELEHFNKKTTASTNEQAMQILHRYGVDCYAAIITSPDWTEQDFKRAGDQMLKMGLKFINLQPLTPLRGVGFEIDEEELVIRRSDYPLWDLAHVSIQPQHMSLEAYYRNILKLYDRIMFHPRNTLQHLVKYPLHMQWRLARGVYQVRKQYVKMIKEAVEYEKDTLHTGHPV